LPRGPVDPVEAPVLPCGPVGPVRPPCRTNTSTSLLLKNTACVDVNICQTGNAFVGFIVTNVGPGPVGLMSKTFPPVNPVGTNRLIQITVIKISVREVEMKTMLHLEH
jgi:hypothetical protein